MNSMWWPPNESLAGFLNQSIFLLFSSIATFNYVMATLTGPGFLPKGWKPKVSRARWFFFFCFSACGAKHLYCGDSYRRVIALGTWLKVYVHCPWNYYVAWCSTYRWAISCCIRVINKDSIIDSDIRCLIGYVTSSLTPCQEYYFLGVYLRVWMSRNPSETFAGAKLTSEAVGLLELFFRSYYLQEHPGSGVKFKRQNNWFNLLKILIID